MIRASVCLPSEFPQKVGVCLVGWGQTVMYWLVKAHAHLVCQRIIGHWPRLTHPTGQTMQERVPSQALSTYKCTNKSKSSQKNSLTYKTCNICLKLKEKQVTEYCKEKCFM